jgi:hypothetical protein
MRQRENYRRKANHSVGTSGQLVGIKGDTKGRYGSLAEILDNQGSSSVIERVAEPIHQVISGQTCSQFGQHLKSCYRTPGNKEWKQAKWPLKLTEQLDQLMRTGQQN